MEQLFEILTILLKHNDNNKIIIWRQTKKSSHHKLLIEYCQTQPWPRWIIALFVIPLFREGVKNISRGRGSLFWRLESVKPWISLWIVLHMKQWLCCLGPPLLHKQILTLSGGGILLENQHFSLGGSKLQCSYHHKGWGVSRGSHNVQSFIVFMCLNTLQPTNSLQNCSKWFIYQCLESYKQVPIGSKLYDWVQYGLKWFKMVTRLSCFNVKTNCFISRYFSKAILFK